MVGGQFLDVEGAGELDLRRLHELKTGALIGASVGCVVALVGPDGPATLPLRRFAAELGVVFQIVDDILDITATDDQLGKPAGHDMVDGVYTLPVLRTLADAGVAADELSDLLGSPLDAVVRDKALSIVRAGEGVAYSREVASGYVRAAADACSSLPDNSASAALRAAPHELLDSVR